jgi:hypothetical protein
VIPQCLASAAAHTGARCLVCIGLPQFGVAACARTWHQQRAQQGQRDDQMRLGPVRSFRRRRSVPTSTRPQQVSAVDEISRGLGPADGRHDGLPRLATILARAATGGVSDSEFGLFRDHLGPVRMQDLNPYPGAVDPATMANWQLGAATYVFVEKTGRGRTTTSPGFRR